MMSSQDKANLIIESIEEYLLEKYPVLKIVADEVEPKGSIVPKADYFELQNQIEAIIRGDI